MLRMRAGRVAPLATAGRVAVPFPLVARPASREERYAAGAPSYGGSRPRPAPRRCAGAAPSPPDRAPPIAHRPPPPPRGGRTRASCASTPLRASLLRVCTSCARTALWWCFGVEWERRQRGAADLEAVLARGLLALPELRPRHARARCAAGARPLPGLRPRLRARRGLLPRRPDRELPLRLLVRHPAGDRAGRRRGVERARRSSSPVWRRCCCR